MKYKLCVIVRITNNRDTVVVLRGCPKQGNTTYNRILSNLNNKHKAGTCFAIIVTKTP